ncbi:MAG TPA: putative Ig domain-containing protein [Vicinamibacterales bacterium]|nr:putative Ig domain-containing protein [Vicinamibacterales bacterium]
MRKALFVSFLAFLLVSANLILRAQSVGHNINVVNGLLDDIGDKFRQRQNEPAIAISAINPDHMMAVFNDYTTIDIENDTGIGPSSNQAGVMSRLFRWFPYKPRAARQKPVTANAEGWIGWAFSDNGAINWQKGLVDGYPNDDDPSTLDVLGPNGAASDPVLAVTDRWFILAGIAFVRNGLSLGFVHRCRDMSDTESGQNIRCEPGTQTKILIQGTNPVSGVFADKPAIAAHPDGRVIVAFVVFDTGITRSKIVVFRSTNHGQSWSGPVTLSQPNTANQSPAILISPNFSNVVYCGWRTFPTTPGGTNRIVGKVSADGGRTWGPSTPYTVVGSFNAADQLGVRSDVGTPQFRTNAYATGAIDGNGAMHVAVAVKVDAAGNPTLPGTPGRSRIMVTTSYTGGVTWRPLRAVDNGPNSGPQFMPVITAMGKRGAPCNKLPLPGGPRSQVMVSYYQARLPANHTGPVAGGNTVIDVKLADTDACLANTGGLVFNAPVNITRFSRSALPPHGVLTEPSAGLNIVDNVEYTAENRAVTNFGGGFSSFLGDYIGLVPRVPMVRVAPGVYRPTTTFGISQSLLPSPEAQVIWADGRDTILPQIGAPTNTQSPYTIDQLPWHHYQPPSKGLEPCVNAGARDQNVYTALATSGIRAGAPVISRNPNIPRTYPVYIENYRSVPTAFQVSIIPPGQGSAAFSLTATGELDVNDRVGQIRIGPHSTVTGTVYVAAGFTNIVPVEVQEIVSLDNPVPVPPPNGLVTVVTLNTEGGTDPGAANDETHTPVVEFVGEVPQDPFSQNPFSQNPFSQNPFSQNTAPGDGLPKTDFIFRVTNAGSVTSGFNAFASVANLAGLQGSYRFEVLINRVYRTNGLQGCSTVEVPQDYQVSDIQNPFSQNPFSQNPFSQNPFSQNPFSQNPFAQNPFSQNGAPEEQASNSTFHVAPSDDGSGTNVRLEAPAPLQERRPSMASGVNAFFRGVLGHTGTTPRATATAFAGGTYGSAARKSLEGRGSRSPARGLTSSSAPPQPATLPSVAPREASEILYIVRVTQLVANPPVVFDPAKLSVTAIAQAPDFTGGPGGAFDPGGPTFTVGGAPLISTATLADATVGTAYTPFQLTAEGGQTPYTWTAPAGSLPPGMTLSTAGVLAGTPTTSGRFSIPFVVTDAQGNSGTRTLTITVITAEQGNQVIFSGTDFVSAGVGGMRDVGSGNITLTGVNGPVTAAFLYWHGPSNSITPSNQAVTFAGQAITGTAIGTADDNNWPAPTCAGDCVYSHSYRADVTALVPGNGTYALSGFLKGTGETINENVNGASLIVLFNDTNDTNNRDVYLFDGNDSNVLTATFTSDTWNTTLANLVYNGGPATLQLHVADGQEFSFAEPDDGALSLNGVVLEPTGSIFEGNTVPPFVFDGLWDIRNFGISSFLAVGTNTLTLTSPQVFDALSLVVAIVSVPSGGGAPPPVTITGDLTYNNADNTIGNWAQGQTQLFELTVDLDEQVTSLSINGTPVDGAQNVGFVQEASRLDQVAVELGTTGTQILAWDDIEIVNAGTGVVIFRGNFTSDTVSQPPGPPPVGSWVITTVNGSALVRAASGQLIAKPVEVAQAGGTNNVSLAGRVSGAPPITGRWIVRWRSLMRSAGQAYPFNFAPVVLRGNSLIIASVEYRGPQQ